MAITLIVIGIIECLFAVFLIKQDAKMMKYARRIDKRVAQVETASQNIADSLAENREYFADVMEPK